MNIFDSVNLPKPFRSKFFPTHERKFSCQMGRLIPDFCEEVLPDDKWSVQTSFKLELAPLIAPLMHNIDVYQYFFYVPNYLLSSAWNTWISQGEPADSANIPYPCRFVLTGGNGSQLSVEDLKDLAGPGSLLDYLGFSNEYARLGQQIPGTTISSHKDYSCFPFLAYNAIWLNYFRNENLQPLPNEWGNPGGYNAAYDNTTNINLSDWKSHNYYYRNNVIAPITAYLTQRSDEDSVNSLIPHSQPRHANFMHDYFTSSLPFTQRGPVVKIPLGEQAPVVFEPKDSGSAGRFINTQTGLPYNFSSGTTQLQVNNNSGRTSLKNSDVSAAGPASYDPEGTLEVDLSEATGISILDLRRFARLQAWLEKNAVGGNTPGENLRNHFGVKPSDASLDRPVFLGGGRVPLAINNVLQTSQSTTGDNGSPLATPSGYAHAAGYAGFKNRYFREHGWIIGILYVMPRSSYMQGTRRYWDRSSRFDYFWMEFERIGEQPVYNWEIYDDGTSSDDNNGEFGYNPRYSDYKYIPSSVHGDFKTSLSFWHAARIFASRPRLNSSFLHLGSDIDRIFAVSESLSTQNCWFWTRNQVKVRRPMMKNPTSILG